MKSANPSNPTPTPTSSAKSMALAKSKPYPRLPITLGEGKLRFPCNVEKLDNTGMLMEKRFEVGTTNAYLNQAPSPVPRAGSVFDALGTELGAIRLCQF